MEWEEQDGGRDKYKELSETGMLKISELAQNGGLEEENKFRKERNKEGHGD